jgi:hypothetical protein
MWLRYTVSTINMAELLRKKPDTQLVELAGRNWLASKLMRAGIEVARPERDRGIDLIAYIDLDERAGDFRACPIQMKAATKQVFSLYPKYAKFPGLILAYVWNLDDSSNTKCFALTYDEALDVAQKMRWTETPSWRHGGGGGKPGYSTTRPSKRLQYFLEPYEMNPDKWWQKINKSDQIQQKVKQQL